MDKELWRQKYINRICQKTQLNVVQATECFDNCEPDYDEDPEEIADEEISYWDV